MLNPLTRMCGTRMSTHSQLSQASIASRWCWAKSFPQNPADGPPTHWLPLYQHLTDAGHVARRLWDDWLPRPIMDAVVRAVGDAAAARSLVAWLAAVHDVGKCSPAFAVQVESLAQDMCRGGFAMNGLTRDSNDRRVARHELVGHIAVEDWLQRRGFSDDRARKLASVVAAHHGRPATQSQVSTARLLPHIIGAGIWVDTRDALIDAATADFAASDDLTAWRSADLPQHVLVLLSGIVIVADWIASDTTLFELCPIGTWPTDSPDDRAEQAWGLLDMPRRWRARPPADDAELFSTRFFQEFDIATPRPVQADVMRLARTCPEACLMIIEAEMGVGKTEAALAAAEILAARFDLNGVFIGLPTQATADAIFARLLEWAGRLGLETPVDARLTHGKASQNANLAELERDAYFRGIANDHSESRASHRRPEPDESVIAHRWFGQPKRGPLASLVVGTIDQALIGALQAKHVMLRHLALAGKVVILDEVHAYDVFMGEYLDRILHWLGRYGVPVIMLSATLPADRRRAFVRAYNSGRGSLAPRPPSARVARRRGHTPPEAAPDPLAALAGNIGYPSIVLGTPGQPPRIIHPDATGGPRAVRVVTIADDLTALGELLQTALDGGGCAAVLCNTVRRAQETAVYLRASGDIPVVLAHARFMAADRAERDRELLRLFGKDPSARPERTILVATQVAEQSLDLDFDVMVSDIAPIDLLLQRAGRLHRHRRASRPRRVGEPALYLRGVDWMGRPPVPDRGSLCVYDQYVLLRTLAVLKGRQTLTLPTDIPGLVQSVYGVDAVGPATWADEIAAAREKYVAKIVEKQRRARSFRLAPFNADPAASLIGLVPVQGVNSPNESEAVAAVRDTKETLEVLVLLRDADGILRTPGWLPRDAGRQIPDTEAPRGSLTRAILSCTLRLPIGMCSGDLIDQHIAELERSNREYPALATWGPGHPLRGELVLVLDTEGEAKLGPFDVHYDSRDGLVYHDRRRTTTTEQRYK